MNDYKVPIIETKRLILRAMKPEDLEDFYEIASNPNVTKFLTYQTHKDIAETKHVMESFFFTRPSNKQYEAYVIEYKENHKMIGGCDFVVRGHSATIGYQLNESYWGQGIMSEAIQAVIDVIFTLPNIERITIEHDPNNIGSKRVIEKAGFKKVGYARKYVPLSDGTFGDAITYDMIKEDRNEDK